MVDHFHEQVIDLRKIASEARAMVVTAGIERAILRRTRIRRREGNGSLAQRLRLARNHRQDSDASLPVPYLRGQVSDPL